MRLAIPALKYANSVIIIESWNRVVRNVRLLIVTFDPPENVGGVEGRARAYTEELLKKRNFVEIISFGSEHVFNSENFHGAKLWKYPSLTKSVPRTFRLAVKEITKNRIESVFLLSGALTFFGILLLFYGRIVGLRTGIFLYGKDILETSRSPFGRVTLVLSQFLARRIMVNSRFTESLLSRAFRRKIRILYPGIDPSMLDNENVKETPDEKARRILFVGRLVRRKGVDDLLAAFKSITVDIPDSELDIVGDGPELLRLEKLTYEMDLSRQVKFYGNLRGRPLFERYRAADVFVMPSRRTKTDVEGFGTVFLEAAMFGKPSIGTISGGIPEAVLDNVTGILIEEGDVRALKASIEMLLKDEELRLRLGTCARERVLSNFTWGDSTNSLVKAFSER
ncbi:MAG: glycosyltransferase family 4 protein [Nitrososphaerales archaeon]